MGEAVGQRVGYKVGQGDHVCYRGDKTLITFVTVGYHSTNLGKEGFGKDCQVHC